MSNDIIPQTDYRIQTSPDEPHFQSAIDIVTYALSETSQRQYRHTFEQWLDFCEGQGIASSDMRAQHLIAFLESSDLSHRTKQARLSHLRRLLQALHAQVPEDPRIRSMYEQAKLLKVKRLAAEKAQAPRPEYRLSKEQVYQALQVFDDDTKRHARNRAMLALLLYCGLRRAELVALQWADIDLENKRLTVRHGKGDKPRRIPILGGLSYLKRWYAIAGTRRFVFCGFRKGDHMAADQPIKTNAVWVVIKQVENVLGLEGLSPHDFRRTLLTDLINSGTPVNIAQAIAGHATAQTTLAYAEIADAEEMRHRAKLSY